ncbi:hypothetical protein BDV28DRAFT_139756 [Aspergillus coremiiformis]|uniref:VWFA domain-containing protein n=1 Tax=Aspergillus coremiiformis TaxID=138285 RepID=A0A5N6YXH8_9EURO|nr:hypothetical protein BDV28DRAFT_139756 [Aspergillus coremiiformis]
MMRFLPLNANPLIHTLVFTYYSTIHYQGTVVVPYHHLSIAKTRSIQADRHQIVPLLSSLNPTRAFLCPSKYSCSHWYFTQQKVDSKLSTMGNRHSRVRRYSESLNRPNITSKHDRHRRVATNVQARSTPIQAHDADPWSPPPYTPQSPSKAPEPRASSSGDSPYSFLRVFDTIFLVDDSGSMNGDRWNEAADAIAAIAPVCTINDRDGIDIYFLNHRGGNVPATGAYTNIRTSDDVREIFYSVHPRGATPVGNRLRQILDPYLRHMESIASSGRDPSESIKPLNIIAITDGVFTDDAESVIIDAAIRLDQCHASPWQIGIQFFQVGNDEEAQKYLQELDDELGRIAKRERMRDIVDTVPWRGNLGQTLSADGILKCVLGAVNRKYDKSNVH